MRFAFLVQTLLRGIRIGEQLLLIPLLIGTFGGEQYGEWIALVSIGSLATFLSFGLGQAAQADIVLLHAGGDREAAASSFHTATMLLAVLAGIAAIVLTVGVAAVDIGPALSVHRLARAAQNHIVIASGLTVAAAFFLEPLAGVVGAVRGIGLSNTIIAVGKVAEIAAVAVALSIRVALPAVADIILASTMAIVMMHAVLVWRLAPWIAAQPWRPSRPSMRRLARNAAGYYGLSISSNVIAVYGPRLAVAHMLGPVTLAGFSVLLTYARIARALPSTIGQSMQVEMGRTFARRDVENTHRLIEGGLGASIVLAVLVGALALLVAPRLLPAWTHGHVDVQWPLLTVLILVAIAGSGFDAALYAAGGLSRVSRIAAVYPIALVVGIAGGSFFMPFVGSPAMAAGMLLAELAGVCTALRVLNRVVAGPGLRRLSLVSGPMFAEVLRYARRAFCRRSRPTAPP